MADLFRTFPPKAGGDVRWVATNPAGNILRRGFFGAPESGGGGGPGLTWRYAVEVGTNNGNETSHTHSAVPIGAEDADRWVIAIIGVATNSATAITSVTIGGVAATAHPENASTIPAGSDGSYVYWANVPGGTTADIITTYNGGTWNSRAAVWTVIGEPTFHDRQRDTAPTDMGSGRLLYSVDVDVPEGGLLIAQSYIINLSAVAWSGATERWANFAYAGYSGADADGLSAQTGRTVSATLSGVTNEDYLDVVTFSVAGGGGPSPAVAEATGSLPLSGSAAGQALAAGTGAGSLPLTGSATGNALAAGQASGSLPLTGTGAGVAPATGTAAGDLPLTGAATAAVGASATAQASGSLPLTGTATGVAQARGDASGSLPLAGSATGVAPVVGQAAGALPLSGAGTAAARATGQASAALPLGGEAAAAAPASATAAGDLPLSGAATGTAEDPASHSTGRLAFAGRRRGQILNAAQRQGTLLNEAPRLGTLVGPQARAGLILNPARRGDLLELTE